MLLITSCSTHSESTFRRTRDLSFAIWRRLHRVIGGRESNSCLFFGSCSVRRGFLFHWKPGSTVCGGVGGGGPLFRKSLLGVICPRAPRRPAFFFFLSSPAA